MKKFLVLYLSPVSARQQMEGATPEQRKAGMEAWMAWAGRAGKAIVDLGAPLGEGVVVGGEKHPGSIGGFSILQAESEEAIKHVLHGHPHLMMPGASIHVLDFLPMPGM